MKFNQSIELTKDEIVEAIKSYVDRKCHFKATNVNFLIRAYVSNVPDNTRDYEVQITAELNSAIVN